MPDAILLVSGVEWLEAVFSHSEVSPTHESQKPAVRCLPLPSSTMPVYYVVLLPNAVSNIQYTALDSKRNTNVWSNEISYNISKIN